MVVQWERVRRLSVPPGEVAPPTLLPIAPIAGSPPPRAQAVGGNDGFKQRHGRAEGRLTFAAAGLCFGNAKMEVSR